MGTWSRFNQLKHHHRRVLPCLIFLLCEDTLAACEWKTYQSTSINTPKARIPKIRFAYCMKNPSVPPTNSLLSYWILVPGS